MELRHLRYFVECAERLHFTQAAEALHVSQPALSIQIQRLEEELGAPLFQRVGRTVRLTEAGSLFLDHARRALREVEAGQQAIQDLNGLLRGSLRIGVTYAFSAKLLPKVLAQFVQLYPAIHVIVTEATTRDVEEGLIHGEFDLGMVFQSPNRDDFQVLKLFKEELYVIVSTRNTLAKAPFLRIRDLEKVQLALPSTGFSTRQLIDQCFAAAHIRPHVVLETNDIDALVAVVRLGAAASLVSRRVVAHLKDVAAIPLKEKGLQRTAALVWPQDQDLIPAAVRFIEMARKILGTDRAL